MEGTLKQIERNTRPKDSFQIIVTSSKSDFTTHFKSPIKLQDQDYEVALVNLETYNSMPNVDNHNNLLRYSVDNGRVWKELRIPEGSYELSQLNKTIQFYLKQDTQADQPYIIISPNTSTLKSTMEIMENFKVDFTAPNSINSLLGFNSAIYSEGYHESPNIVNICSINSIFVLTDMINGSYVNGELNQVIYSFFPNVSPGYKIVESPKNLVYLPLNKSSIYQINVKLTDQDGNILNLRGESITARFHIRQK